MQANLKGVSEATGLDEIIPEGTYKMVCSAYKEDITKGGIPTINLTWTVLEGDYKGQEIEDVLFFSPKGLRRVKSVCKRLGVKKNLDENIELEQSDFFSVKAYVNIEIEKYTDKNDKERHKNRVQYYPGYNEPPSVDLTDKGNGQAGAGAMKPSPKGAAPAQQADKSADAPPKSPKKPAAGADPDAPPDWMG
jgi:hypothetical protein